MEKLLIVLAQAIKLIGILLKNKDVQGASATLDAVELAWEVIQGATRGSITPEQALKDLENLAASISANDEAADAALDSKFL